MTLNQLARSIQRALKRSDLVEIDGLGVFKRNKAGEIAFCDSNHARIFISYAAEDIETAEALFTALSAKGYAAWLDRHKLLPGQNWPKRIEDAIASSDFFVPCYSKSSVSKRGNFQAEVRFALECATRLPLDDVFIIPVRLDDCLVPARIQKETQYVDLFPDWKAGLQRVFRIIDKQVCMHCDKC